MNQLADLPPEAKKELSELIGKAPIMEATGIDPTVVFLLQVLTWLQVDDPQFPYKPS